MSEEQSYAKRARTALWVGVGAYWTSLTAQAFTTSVVVDQFNQAFSQAGTPRSARTVTVAPTYPSWYPAVSAVSQITTLVTLAVGILFLVWFHRAVSNAQALGIPQRRSPGWAVGGWFIPIGNLFLPYQSALDLFPQGSPDRKLVGRWWAFYLSASFGAIFMFIAAFIATAAAVAVAALIAVLWMFAAIAGRSMIQQALDVHQEMAASGGQEWGHFAATPPSKRPNDPSNGTPDPWSRDG